MCITDKISSNDSYKRREKENRAVKFVKNYFDLSKKLSVPALSTPGTLGTKYSVKTPLLLQKLTKDSIKPGFHKIAETVLFSKAQRHDCELPFCPDMIRFLVS